MKRSIKKRLIPSAQKAVRYLAEVDPNLGRLIKKVGKVTIELDPNATVFESLARSIVYQQIHGKAAAAILTRFKTHFGSEARFPSPEQVLAATDDELTKTGLSRNKRLAIQDLARKANERSIPLLLEAADLDDETLIEQFSQVRGIGTWTAQMLLIFTLGRPDVFPSLDFGVRKGFMKVYGKRKFPTPKSIEKESLRWKPFRSFAAWYFWRALELEEYKDPPKKKNTKPKKQAPSKRTG